MLFLEIIPRFPDEMWKLRESDKLEKNYIATVESYVQLHA